MTRIVNPLDRREDELIIDWAIRLRKMCKWMADYTQDLATTPEQVIEKAMKAMEKEK